MCGSFLKELDRPGFDPLTFVSNGWRKGLQSRSQRKWACLQPSPRLGGVILPDSSKRFHGNNQFALNDRRRCINLSLPRPVVLGSLGKTPFCRRRCRSELWELQQKVDVETKSYSNVF